MADALDLEQEGFRTVATAIEDYDPNPSLDSFRGWIEVRATRADTSVSETSEITVDSGELWLSVVVPAWNEAGGIERAVRSAVGPGTEVIVVDGGSDDGTPERARSAEARVVVGPRGRAVQMNAGAAAARGQILLFLHGDTVLPEGFQSLVRSLMDSDRVALGAFRLRIEGLSIGLRLVEWGVRVRCAVLGLPYGDQGLFLRSETFRRIGGYEDVPIMEDVRMVRQARKLGRVRVVDQAVTTSARRWERAGVVRMSVLNLGCLLAGSLGISPARLKGWRERVSGGR